MGLFLRVSSRSDFDKVVPQLQTHTDPHFEAFFFCIHMIIPNVVHVKSRQSPNSKEMNPRKNQRETKGQQLKGKIVSALFSHFSALFHTSSEFFLRDFS